MSKKKQWEESKHLKGRNKKDPSSVIKEVQIMVGISDNDLSNKIKTIGAFLDRFHSVKLWIQVKRRYRYKQSQDDQQLLFDKVIDHTKKLGTARDITHNARGLSCILIPNKKQISVEMLSTMLIIRNQTGIYNLHRMENSKLPNILKYKISLSVGLKK